MAGDMVGSLVNKAEFEIMKMQMDALAPKAVVSGIKQSAQLCICIDHYKADKFEFQVEKDENLEPTAPPTDSTTKEQRLIEAEEFKYLARPRSPNHVTVVGTPRLSKMFQ